MEPLVLGGGFLLLKVAGAVFSVVVIYFTYRLFPRLALAAASGMVAFYGAVAFWNILVLLVLSGAPYLGLLQALAYW